MVARFDPRNWSLRAAAHLANRAGFGGTPEEIHRLHAAGFPVAVDQLLNAPADDDAFQKPAWAAPVDFREMRMKMRDKDEETRQRMLQEKRREQRRNMMDLVQWWLRRMQTTPNPLREKMTLFWHGHFATSVQKVKQSYMMWRQNETLRQNALGPFPALVKAVSRDPAMMVWLDTRESRAIHPNENFARELMELFTLGIGHYSERDVQEAARAFTGYRINPATQTFRFARVQHDPGEKSVLGKTGSFSGDDVIDILAAQPACAEFIVRKLWTFLAYEGPEPPLVESLASDYRASGFDTKNLLRQILTSAPFFSEKAVRTQIKSPVQWLVQTVKVLETELPPAPLPAGALRQLGQMPFEPPNVKGWDGGKAWITTATLLQRYNFANFLVGNGPLPGGIGGGRDAVDGEARARRGAILQRRMAAALDLDKLAPKALRRDPQALVRQLCRRLFQDDLTPAGTAPFVNYLNANSTDDGAGVQTIRGLLHLMMSTPQYQIT